MPQLLAQSSARSTVVRNVRRALYKISTTYFEADRLRSQRMACFPGELIGREIALTGIYEGDILKAAFDNLLSPMKARFAGTHCLDIGANIGNHTCFLSKFFQRVIAFEPNPVCFSLLQCNININAIDAIACNFGLSNIDTTMRFAENHTNLGGSGFIDDAVVNDGAFVEKQLVVRRGDDFLNENFTDCEISFIKVDVEGHELLALKGLQAILLRYRPVLAVEMYSSRPDGEELMMFLQSLGYSKFLSVTKNAYRGKFLNLVSKLSSRVYAHELANGYAGDHDFVIVS